MRTTSRFFPSHVVRLLPAVALLTTNLSATTPAPVPVSQAWDVRILGPTNTFVHSANIEVGPFGDVFVGGYVRRADYTSDIVISRRSPTGALLWETQYEPPEGSAGNETAFGLVTDGTNVYVTGSITSATGRPDFLTLKYRDTGELEWAARTDGPSRYNDSANDVLVDGQGNVLVLGGSYSPTSSRNIVVLKYGPTGNLLWTYFYDSPENGADFAAGMRVDASGNIYVAGTSGPSSEDPLTITLKLDPEGRELWTARESAGNPYGFVVTGIDLDSAGNVAIAARDRSYCVTWKYDANGNLQWMTRYRAEDSAYFYPHTIRFDGSGNIITSASQYGAGINDGVLIKYAGADGRQLWATRIGDPTGSANLNALAVDTDGNSYLTTSPASDVITVKVNPEGAQLWAVTYSSEGSFSDYGEQLEVTGTGDIFVAGRSTHFNESFVSLVKYTQQPVAGVVTAVVTPTFLVVDPGTNVVFTAEASGPAPIHYQWRMNGRSIPDATNATLALLNVQISNRGDYSVIVSNQAGATVSPEARLSVRTPPQVVIAPTETIAYLGTDAAFIATLAGNDFATLQWRHNGTPITGATNETLRLVDLNAAAAGTYDIVVSTIGGITTSSTAGLRISRAVEVVEITPHQSADSTGEYAPQLQVLPTGEFLIAARSNHLAGSSIALYKHAADGGLVWTSAFESNEFTNAEPSRMALDSGGNIYISGVSRQPYLPAALAVLKFSPGGQRLWSRILTGTNLWNSVHAFAVDPSGNSTIAVLGTGETKVIHYDPAGDVQWSFIDPLSADNDTIALAVDVSGAAYLGTTIRVDMGADNEIRLRKFDATGGLVWTRPHAEGQYNRLGALAVDSAGHLIVAGMGQLADTPDSWMFVQKYSPGGERLWETRTGSSWSEISYIVAMAVGPGDEITVLTRSDDDYPLGEQSGVTRIVPDGRLIYRIAEPQVFVSSSSQLGLDDFGNAYVTGWGARAATAVDAVTAKYDAFGNRPWLVYYNGPISSWQYGLAVGADAVGDIRVLAVSNTRSDANTDFSVLHYRQLDPQSKFRLQLIPDAGGTFHLEVPEGETFRIEASADLQSWSVLNEQETQQLLQPGATVFSGAPRRFFRLVAVE